MTADARSRVNRRPAIRHKNPQRRRMGEQPCEDLPHALPGGSGRGAAARAGSHPLHGDASSLPQTPPRDQAAVTLAGSRAAALPRPPQLSPWPRCAGDAALSCSGHIRVSNPALTAGGVCSWPGGVPSTSPAAEKGGARGRKVGRVCVCAPFLGTGGEAGAVAAVDEEAVQLLGALPRRLRLRPRLYVHVGHEHAQPRRVQRRRHVVRHPRPPPPACPRATRPSGPAQHPYGRPAPLYWHRTPSRGCRIGSNHARFPSSAQWTPPPPPPLARMARWSA